MLRLSYCKSEGNNVSAASCGLNRVIIGLPIHPERSPILNSNLQMAIHRRGDRRPCDMMLLPLRTDIESTPGLPACEAPFRQLGRRQGWTDVHNAVHVTLQKHLVQSGHYAEVGVDLECTARMA